MALFLYVLLPLAWALTGRLLGSAVSLSAPGPAGQRLGGSLGRCCAVLLPALYGLLLVLGVRGDAGHGVRLFGSEELFGLLALPVYLVPALALYAGGAYVVRDLLGGLRSRGAEKPPPSTG
jgi:hypothetical protein